MKTRTWPVAHQCGYCQKWVCEKPMLGTLHFCLPEDERDAIDQFRWQIEQQRRFGA